LPTADDFFRVAVREPVAEAPVAEAPKPRPARSRRPHASGTPAHTPPDVVTVADPSADAQEKVTFYLPRSLLKSLEVVRVRVLMDHDVKVTRSQIAEAVITTALSDVDALERLVLDRLAGLGAPE
jgi:hypothetical protein